MFSTVAFPINLLGLLYINLFDNTINNHKLQKNDYSNQVLQDEGMQEMR